MDFNFIVVIVNGVGGGEAAGGASNGRKSGLEQFIEKELRSPLFKEYMADSRLQLDQQQQL